MPVYEIKELKASSDTFRKAKEGTWSYMLTDDVETSKIRSIVERVCVTDPFS